MSGNLSQTQTPPPTRAQRLQCWRARDQYFKCLDANLAPGEHKEKSYEDCKECEKFKKEFEKNCNQTWVKYFLKKHVLDIRKAEFLTKELQSKENSPAV